MTGLALLLAPLAGCPEEEEAPPPVKRGTVTVSVVDADGNPTNSVLSDGIDYAVLQITAKDANNNPWSGTLDVRTDLGAFGGAVPSADAQVSTDTNGEAAAQFTCIDPATGDPSAAGSANVMVQNIHATVRLTISCQSFNPAWGVELSAPSGTSFHADAFSEIFLTADVTGRYGTAEEDAPVVFESLDGIPRLCPTTMSPCADNMLSASLTVASGTNGAAQALLRAPAEPGVVQVQASWTYDISQPAATDLLTIPFALNQASIDLFAERSSIPASGSGSVNLTSVVRAPDGNPVADGANVTFRVSGGPYTLGTPAATTQTVAVAGGVGQAVVALNGSTTMGSALVSAEYVEPNGNVMRSAPVAVEFVEPGRLLILLNADPTEIWTDDQESATVGVTVERDGAPVSGLQVRFFLTDQDAALGTFGAQGSAPSISDAQRVTNAAGEANVELRGFFAGAAGSVVVHASAEDAQNGNQIVEATIFVLLKRHPLLQSVVFDGANPAVLGTQGSPRPSTSIVTFKAFNDNSEPMEGIEFRFLRPITIDPMVTVTTAGGGDTATSAANGSVVAYLSAGVQAHPVRVIAEATDPRTGFTLTVTSDSIPITSGLASYTHSWFVCDESKAAMPPPNSRSCVAVLADRFSERVPAGHSVQFRVESGNITPNTETGGDGSTAAATYLTGSPPPSDTKDSAGALGTNNPTDFLVSMLAYTRGEEPFTDQDGNGVYDSGEPFVDFPEPFVDKQDNCVRNDGADPTDEYYVASGDPYMILQRTDPFVDGNNDGVWNGGNNAWDDDTLIWFQDWTLYVGDPRYTKVIDADCADGLVDPNRCGTLDHLPWVEKEDTVRVRYRTVDWFGNCPAPGLLAVHTVEVENGDGGETLPVGRRGCGLDTGRYATEAGTGHVKPYCRVFKNLEIDEDTLSYSGAQEGLGAHPFETEISFAGASVGLPTIVTVTFSGQDSGGLPIERSDSISFLVPCTTHEDCGGVTGDPTTPQCDISEGLCPVD